ncbi:MAG TPA: adenylosuccinate synthase [Thermoanaerobaculia bacterium]|nr:adenylosuccinate synthase [Thermoanaerobaculia bacterium]
MANVVVVGMQWGDEGKGKVVDLVCPAFDAVVRFQGGHNAGHTVRFGERHFSLRLIPSGILHEGTACVLGNGMVVSPEAFLGELEELHDAGVDSAGRLFVSDRATVLLPTHVALDQARERAAGDSAIGTTSRGIGPAYESKAGRYGLRMVDLAEDDLEERLAAWLALVRPQIEALGGAADPEALDPAALAGRCREWGERLAPYLAPTETLLHGWLAEGKSLLFEGAQGALLDVDHGTFPFVTSSSSSAGGAATGTGVPPTALDGVLGLLKAYTTRVGAGPFTTELTDPTGEFLRKRGNEFGTVTGRPRRCGWLDLVAARYAKRLNGVGGIALTKLDVLDDLPEIRVCTAYRIAGRETTDFPASRTALAAAEPVYRTVPGWRTPTAGKLEWEDLPQAARDYVRMIEDELEAPVLFVSTGPRREETILRRGEPGFAELTGGRL